MWAVEVVATDRRAFAAPAWPEGLADIDTAPSSDSEDEDEDADEEDADDDAVAKAAAATSVLAAETRACSMARRRHSSLGAGAPWVAFEAQHVSLVNVDRPRRVVHVRADALAHVMQAPQGFASAGPYASAAAWLRLSGGAGASPSPLGLGALTRSAARAAAARAKRLTG